MFSGKTVLVGITGAIAAYKTLELIRMFKRNNAEVKVVVTENALEFVTLTTLQTLSQNPVFIKQFDVETYCPEHISLADSADLFVIAPLSANTLGKIANGLCDNLLTSVACAYKKPMIVAPSMNTGMWDNDFVQENLKKLKAKNVEIVEPEDGFLACGTDGKGRLASLDKIFEKAQNVLLPRQILLGKKVVVSAGGTKENIDPVRYIGNYSSGKMGLALADSAFRKGADVTLISTFDVDRKYKVVKVDSALEMQKEVLSNFENADSLVMTAAVSDFRVKEQAENKIKKGESDSLTIELVKNPDILAQACSVKKENQVVIGFCAETQDLIENAKSKIANKKCDYIVANDVSKKDIGFSSDYNEVYIVDKTNNVTKIEKDTKENIARKIIEAIYG